MLLYCRGHVDTTDVTALIRGAWGISPNEEEKCLHFAFLAIRATRLYITAGEAVVSAGAVMQRIWRRDFIWMDSIRAVLL